MKPTIIQMPTDERAPALKDWLQDRTRRLGLITSIDGTQLVTLVLDTASGKPTLWESKLDSDGYPSLTPTIPQCHWYERSIWDMFGLNPHGHPRLKHNLLHEPYDPYILPLRKGLSPRQEPAHRMYHHLEVKGEGCYELPVGPIHAGIIEPGHFRFSCMGEIIVNLEIRLGYVHRGVEKRLTKLPWTKTRHAAESAASDSVAANALANAIALESILDVEVSPRAQLLRTLSLEIERVAMHIADLGGLAGDIGFLAVSSSMGRLRGAALGLSDLLTGTRFQRSFICPGGITNDPGDSRLRQLKDNAHHLKKCLDPVLAMFMRDQMVHERMQYVGRTSPQLARDFGFVGVAARACGVEYDARQHFAHGLYPQFAPQPAVEPDGDVFCRAKVRVSELQKSLDIICEATGNLRTGSTLAALPEQLAPDCVGVGIVEAHRGELIHLVFTNERGEIVRYAIKDPSVNNWTALAIAVRNNLVADFPLCNKSFSLSYSGNDL